MHRGTTPSHTFTIPHTMFDIDIDNIYITYMQNDNIILEKTIDKIDRDGCKITVTLTQEETLLFTENVIAYAQIRIKDVFGCALASQYIPIKVDPIIKEGAI